VITKLKRQIESFFRYPALINIVFFLHRTMMVNPFVPSLTDTVNFAAANIAFVHVALDPIALARTALARFALARPAWPF
jgi:type II secretory pathway component PulF